MSLWDVCAVVAVIAATVIFAGPMDWGRRQTGALVVLTYFLFSGGVAVILL